MFGNMSSNDENEVTMEDSTPEVKNDKGPKTTTQNSTGPRPVSPSGVKISDDFIYMRTLNSSLNYMRSRANWSTCIIVCRLHPVVTKTLS
ncbi:hypothetical protein CDAR_567041 [Caerostris darwini]|uniref:Uncharacterized protein n=1 Tax=Caerostris darwini TaxID=1538125 RepID=A0AAV4SMD8_9ARAC|nr:hypothetical protein CDAR_567041 [Caerostris darwini]